MRILLVPLTAFVLLAGCTTPAAIEDPLVVLPNVPLLADGTPAPLTLAFADCTEQFGVFPTPADEMAPYVPAGFEMVPFDENVAMATVFVVGYTCTHGNATVSEFMGGLGVLPPEAWRSANVTQYGIALGAMTDRAELLEVYHAWGGNGTHFLGDVEIAQMAPENPALRIGQASGSDHMGAIHMETMVAGTGTPSPAGAARLFLVEWNTMNVTSAFDFAWTTSTMGSDQGTANLAFDGAIQGLLPQTAPGLGFHFWGDYDYTMTYVPLA